MGNCTTMCSNAAESKKEKRAKKLYKKSINRPKMAPQRPQTPQSQSVSESQSESKLQSESKSSSSSISNLSTDITPSINETPSIHAKTMELLSPSNDNSVNGNNDSIGHLDTFGAKETNKRIRRLSDIISPVELEQVINQQYSHKLDQDDDDDHDQDDDDQDDVESVLSENEKLEIERRKSDAIKEKLLQPNLIRDNTRSPWNEQDIDQLESDMEKQLSALHTLNREKTNEKINNNDNNSLLTIPNNYRIMISSEEEEDTECDDDDNDNNENRRVPSSLFREKSRDKWDTKQMENVKGDMQRAMIDLIKSKRTHLQNKSISSSSSITSVIALK